MAPITLLLLCFAHISYYAIDANFCGGKLSWIENELVIPREEGMYKNNMHCIFETDFKTGIDPINVLQLTFYSKFHIQAEMPSCTTDYLEIFVSCSFRSIGRFCGTIRPGDIISPDRCLRVVFHSDQVFTGRGFNARLIVTAKPNNLTPLHNYRNLVTLDSSPSSGIFSSPGYPFNYPAYLEPQTFLFEATQKGTEIRLYFMEFKTNSRDGGGDRCTMATDDVLSIEVLENTGVQGSKVKLNKLCGERKPFYSTWNKYTSIRITFRTNNDSVVSRGFVAGYVIYEAAQTTYTNKCSSLETRLEQMMAIMFVMLASYTMFSCQFSLVLSL